jgi:hypothetical protein
MGNWDQIKEDIEGCKELNADELSFDPFFAPEGKSIDGVLSLMERLRELI